MKTQKIAAKQNKQPGIEAKMHPRPKVIKANYRGAGKLNNKVALITGSWLWRYFTDYTIR